MVVSEGAINNIMGGMENTAGVRLHSHRHKLKQRFDIVRKLGQGTYGKVQLALNKETGQEVAIKTIKKAKIETEQDLVRIRREIQIMSSVQHPQIIHIYEVFENREKMVLVMEYAAGGELYDYLSERKVLPEEEARRIFRQVASAVYYCHKHKICHRDLKLENILLDLDGNAKIADFGLSNVFDEKQRLDTFCGSPLYASPEIVKGVPYIGPEVDCWSLGVLLYTLVYGAMPFDGSNFRRLVKQITQGDFYEPSNPATASELIRHMLTVQSTERANIEDICNHWWVNEGYSDLCLTQAEALANQTPVRLDLLLSLAPKHISSEHMLIQPDDEDVSQKSDSDRAPPNLKIPPPPALLDGELEAEPLPIRSHSLGAVPPPGGVSVDLLIEKKKREKEKRKKEKESTLKRPPSSRPLVEEEKKPKKKEEKSDVEEKRSVKRETSLEGERETVKKRAASTERERSKKRDSSRDRDKDKVIKRDVSGDREKNKKKEDSVEEVKKEAIKESSKMDVEKKIMKKRDSSLTRKASTKKKGEEQEVTAVPPTTTSTAESSLVPEQKVEEKEIKEISKPSSTKSVPKSKSSEKKISKKLDDFLPPKVDSEKDTDKILKETAAKIEKVESLIEEEKDILSPVISPVTSPVISPPVTSPLVSSPSSQATSPVRSRTGSESSTEAPRTKSESSSRRQSKIFSKAALFDPALSPQHSKSPPPQDKAKKITRPGALNLSDLTKRFEEKPSNEKINKVVAPFKVSDARKAFESKSDKSVSESPKRKASGGSNGDSGTVSPKDSLPVSPTKADKTMANSLSKISLNNKSTNKVNRETSPIKKVSKSPPKEISNKDAGRVSPVKREKSPKKEASPTKTISKIVPKVSSFSKSKEEKEKSVEPKPVPKKEKEPDAVPATTKASEREIEISRRGDTSDSSDSESEAEKMLKQVSEKREKLELAKKEKMKKVSEGKEPQNASKDMPSIREEAQNIPTVSSVPGVATALQETKDQKFATLPRGFKAKTELTKPQMVKPNLPKMSSVEEAHNGEPVKKRSQVGIVLQNQNRQANNLYDGKRSSFSEVRSQSPRPEFRTEVQHTIGTPEPRAPPEPQLQRARRERIIPIMLEDDVATENDIRGTSSRSSVIQPSSSSSSRTSSVSSVPRSGFGVTPLSATVSSSASADRQKLNHPNPESLKKSRRERIIPIAVEGEGMMTPSVSESRSTEKVRSFQRQGSSQGSFNRGRGYTLDRADSFSSAGEDEDEEEDGFQILTAESLFSTLLSRVRSLTRKMGGEDSGRSSNIGGAIRRVPQPGINSDTPSSAGSSENQSGFWSSLYSPPRDIPGRTIPLSRGHSREDPFEGFGQPLWERSLSRNTSDSDSVFSEPSGPFSTLPRGWRARRSAREESIVEGDEGLSSFTPSRRQFYSRTLSRDLPLKTVGDSKRPGNRNSWDASTSSGTIPRTSAAPGSTLSAQCCQEPISRIEIQHQNKNTTNNPSLGVLNSVGLKEPFSSASTLIPSGEAFGRAGGHFEQHKNNFNAQLASLAPGKEKEEQTTGKQSVQQLQELVSELESIPDGQVTSEREKSRLKFISSGNQVSLNSPIPSKSCTSFQMPNQLISSSSSNPNIVFSVTISGPRHRLLQNNSLETNAYLKTSNSNPINSLEEPVANTISASRIINKVTSDTCSSTESKNTFIPYNRTLSNCSQKILNSETSKARNLTSQQNSAIAKGLDTSPVKINSSEKLNGFVKQAEKSSEYSKPVSSVVTKPKVTDANKVLADQENKKYLTIEPYKRGRSEDLKAAIDIVNTSNSFIDSSRSSFRPYGKSKSRDITPAIEAASGKFTQLNSGTLRKISPFEAYKRSKSKELGSSIDIVNINDIRMKSPPPVEMITRSDSCMSQFEKAKTSFEKKFDKAKSPPPEFEKLRSPPREFEKVKLASLNTEVASKEVVDNTINLAKELKENTTTTDVQKDKEKHSKDPEKSKSVYKIITSKFSRSLSNLGEDKQESKQSKETEEEANEKEDKFKLKRPSIFMKTKMEKCSSKTSLSEIESKEDDFDKNEKKTSKLSHALNKFLGRKVDESPNKINKEPSHNFPKKSTSVVTIPDKLKKPPRFRTKKFSKSHENLNRGEDDAEDYTREGRAKSVMPASQRTEGDNALESANNEICNHRSQIEINITSRIDNNTCSSTEVESKPTIITTPANSNHVPSIASYGLSPALASKRNVKVHQNSVEESSGLQPELDSSRKKLSGEFSEDDSITPTTESALSGLEDIKEVEDESVMDRITRKSYYSRFNEMKRKPKLRRIDSKESMDQQLAAAKARLMQDEENTLLNSRDSLNSSRATPQRFMSISPPLVVNEGVTRRTLKGSMPRTISLPPEDGIGLYNGGIRSSPFSRQEESAKQVRQPFTDQCESGSYYRSTSTTRDETIPYRRQFSSNLEEPSTYKRLSSVGRDEIPFYLRQSSVPREEQPAFRLPSVVRDETPTFRRLSAAMREDPQLRRLSMTREEQPTFRRLSSTNFHENTDKRGSSVARDEMNSKRISMPREENPGYHTLQYRKSNQNDDQFSKRYSSFNRDIVGRQTDLKEKCNGSSPTSPSSSPSISFPQKISETSETDGKDYDKLEAFAVATAAGKAAGEAAAAAAAISSTENSQSIPTPLSPCSASDSAAVKSAREELTRRLTPLTRLSAMGSGESNIRPYRRTVTSGNLPIGQSNISKPSTYERPSYRRTTTMDLPPMDSRPRTNDRRILQDQTRRYSGNRSTENGLDSPITPSNRSPYGSFAMPTSTYSPLHSPPSMNTILRRTSFYRY